MLECFSGEKMPEGLNIVELSVYIHCERCAEKIKKTIFKLNGIDAVDVDREQQKVTVSGFVDERKVLRAVKRTGTRAEPWPIPEDGEAPEVYLPPHLDDVPALQYASTYAYSHHHPGMIGPYAHGSYSGTVISHEHDNFTTPAYYPHVMDNHTAAAFNDDNAHACIIM